MRSLLSNNEGQKRCGFFFNILANFVVYEFSYRLYWIIRLSEQICTKKILFKGMLSSAKGKELNWSSVLSLFKILFKTFYDLIWNTSNSSKRSKNWCKNTDIDVKAVKNEDFSQVYYIKQQHLLKEAEMFATFDKITRRKGKAVWSFLNCTKFLCMSSI